MTSRRRLAASCPTRDHWTDAGKTDSFLAGSDEVVLNPDSVTDIGIVPHRKEEERPDSRSQ